MERRVTYGSYEKFRQFVSSYVRLVELCIMMAASYAKLIRCLRVCTYVEVCIKFITRENSSIVYYDPQRCLKHSIK